MTRPLNPRTTPLGVLLIAGLPTDKALAVVRDLETPAVIEQAIRAESRCLSRSAVMAALKARLAARRQANRAGAERQTLNAQRSTHNSKRRGRKA